MSILETIITAETAKRWWPKGKEAIFQAAIDTAKRWVEGKATIEEVRKAAYDAYAADAAHSKARAAANRKMIRLILKRVRGVAI